MIVLLSDGNPCVVRSILSARKHGASFFQIGSRAFSASLDASLRQDDLELTIIECHTKVKTCLSLISTIKKRRPDIPVLFISSGDDNGQTIAGAFQRGARDCFTLPLDLAQFKERILVIRSFKNGQRERRIPLSSLDGRRGDTLDLRSDLPESIIRVLNYLEDNLSERDHSLSRLARIAGMSPFHFCRIFKKHTDHSPMRYLTRIRVEAAKKLLKYHSHAMSISQIASSLGFYDASNLNRHFKRLTGLPPSEFARSAKSS